MKRASPWVTYEHVAGQVLACFRVNIGLDQETLGNAAHISQSTWSKIERGRSALTLSQIKPVCTRLLITPAELFDAVDQVVDHLRKKHGIRLANRHETNIALGELRSDELRAVVTEVMG